MTIAPDQDRPEGFALDAYFVERELGRGGMATVYVARDIKHGRRVALKVLRPELAASLGAERFRREITLAASLQHPHIVPVHDSGETASGVLWFTMPLIEGESLRERLRSKLQLPVAEAVRITREVALALDYAHRRGVIHRDIKPENILLVDGQAMVADFGIARALASITSGETLTATGIAVGTPAYMSPEQAAAERALNPATDIYSLGAVCYEMLTGEPPYPGPTAQAIAAKMRAGEVPSIRRVRPTVPAALEAAVRKALAPVPADRYETAAEFATALEGAAHVVSAQSTGREAPPAPMWLAFGILIAVGILFAWWSRQSRLTDRALPTSANPVRLAVLPFDNLGDSADAYFAAGMTDAVRGKLTSLAGLEVIGSSSSAQYRKTAKTLQQIGQDLGVRYLLVGTVRWAKETGPSGASSRVRVSPELIDVTNAADRWEQPFDAPLTDVFQVQTDIAGQVAQQLQLALTPAARQTLAARPTGDLVAYDLYLQGRFAWNQRSEATLPQAVRYFEQATARDSGFAPAFAGLADAYILLASYASVSPAVTWPKAKAAADRALALDSTLAEAYTSLAYGTMLYDWNWERAESLFKRAITEDPAYANAHHWYANYLAGRGRLDEALREMRRAAALDPLSRVIGSEVGWVLYTMHQYDEAIVQCERILRLDPTFAHTYLELGLAQIGKGRYQDAILSLRRALELGGTYAHVPAALAAAYAASGDRTDALTVLHDLERRSAHEYVAPFAFAVVYTALGQKAEAFTWLHVGIDQHDIFLPENFNDPLLDPLRRDPRYADVARRMGLGASGASIAAPVN